jgi:hypothetical protein
MIKALNLYLRRRALHKHLERLSKLLAMPGTSLIQREQVSEEWRTTYQALRGLS